MNLHEIALIAGMALVTFGVRYLPLALVGRMQLPAPVLDALTYIPPAVLTAIVAPALLMPESRGLDVSLGNEYLVAGLVAIVVAAWSRRTAATIAVGMAALWLWRWLWLTG